MSCKFMLFDFDEKNKTRDSNIKVFYNTIQLD